MFKSCPAALDACWLYCICSPDPRQRLKQDLATYNCRLSIGLGLYMAPACGSLRSWSFTCLGRGGQL